MGLWNRDALDLRGGLQPDVSERVLVRLRSMDSGDVLHVVVDDGEPFAEVNEAVTEAGHCILERRRQATVWMLVIEAA